MLDHKEISFNFLLIGGVPLKKILNFSILPNVNATVIDARKKEFISNDYKNFKEISIINEVIHTSRNNIYLNLDESSSSLYEPDYQIIKRYRNDNVFELKEKIQIKSKKFSDVVFLKKNYDLTSIYIQGSELNFLEDNKEIICNSSLLITNHFFEKIYKDICTFEKIITIMDNYNFKFSTHLTINKFNDKDIDGLALYINKKKYPNTNKHIILLELGLFEIAKWEFLNDFNEDLGEFKKLIFSFATRKYPSFKNYLKLIVITRHILSIFYFPLIFFDKKLKSSNKEIYKLVSMLINFKNIYNNFIYNFLRKIFKRI